jgi:hypothetical protein
VSSCWRAIRINVLDMDDPGWAVGDTLVFESLSQDSPEQMKRYLEKKLVAAH